MHHHHALLGASVHVFKLYALALQPRLLQTHSVCPARIDVRLGYLQSRTTVVALCMKMDISLQASLVPRRTDQRSGSVHSAAGCRQKVIVLRVCFLARFACSPLGRLHRPQYWALATCSALGGVSRVLHISLERSARRHRTADAKSTKQPRPGYSARTKPGLVAKLGKRRLCALAAFSDSNPSSGSSSPPRRHSFTRR